jgi:hypothetical protein
MEGRPSLGHARNMHTQQRSCVFRAWSVRSLPHHDPVSRRRQWKGKSQIWDSKIWSWVTRDLNQTKTALARASSIYKRQNRPLIREGAPPKQDHDCQTVINIWLWAPDGARHQDLLTDWPSVAIWLWLWLQTVGPVWRWGRIPPPQPCKL